MNYARWRSFEDWQAFTHNTGQSAIGSHIKLAGARPLEGGQFSIAREFCAPSGRQA